MSRFPRGWVNSVVAILYAVTAQDDPSSPRWFASNLSEYGLHLAISHRGVGQYGGNVGDENRIHKGGALWLD